MTSIWKYQLANDVRQVVLMPGDVKILSVAIQHETVCLWAQVGDSEPKRNRIIEISGTGHPREEEEEGIFIGTVLMAESNRVFHVFDMGWEV